MHREPIRLPAWIVGLLTVVLIPLTVDLMTGERWQDAVPAALVAASAIIGVAESKRARVDSPATIERRYIEAVNRVGEGP